MKKIAAWGTIAVLIGLSFTIGSLYLADIVSPSLSTSSWQRTGINLLNTLGIAVVGFGIFSIVVQIRDWRSYFEERIKTIILEQEYLNKLDGSILKDIQTKAFKAYYKSPNIEKPGSFLEYFQENLHQYIAEPYREDVSAEVFLEKSKRSTLLIFDKVTYVCRKGANHIQPRVKWVPDKHEFTSILSIKAEIQFPYNHPDRGKRETIFDSAKFDLDDPQSYIVDVDISNHKNIDGLIVIMEARYEISKGHFQYWQMSHPTKNLSITLQYPSTYILQHKSLVLNPELQIITQRRGYFNFKYDSWMLPQSGLAWRLL